MSRTSGLALAGVALLCGCAALAGLLELLFVPLYAGASLVPVTVLFAIGGNLALPRLARGLLDSTVAAAAPFLAWLVVVIGIGLTPRPEGDVILPGGGKGVEWVGYGVLLGGALAGTLSVAVGGTRRTAVPDQLSR